MNRKTNKNWLEGLEYVATFSGLPGLPCRERGWVGAGAASMVSCAWGIQGQTQRLSPRHLGGGLHKQDWPELWRHHREVPTPFIFVEFPIIRSPCSNPTATPAALAFSTSSLIFELAAAPSFFPFSLSPHRYQTNLLKTLFWSWNYMV